MLIFLSILKERGQEIINIAIQQLRNSKMQMLLLLAFSIMHTQKINLMYGHWQVASMKQILIPSKFVIAVKNLQGLLFIPQLITKKNEFESFAPYGFGKDLKNVYYYDFQGTAKIVKGCNAASFKSLGDGYFGYDEKSVFCGSKILSKAKPETWNKLQSGYFYSQDINKIYYLNRLMKDADSASFEIVVVPSVFKTPTQYAKDKDHYYFNDEICSKNDFDKWVKEETALNQKFIHENKIP